MALKNDPEKLKIPAYMRNKVIVKQARQKLLWTAWDRKEAGAKPNSAQVTGKLSKTPRTISSSPKTQKKATTFENPLLDAPAELVSIDPVSVKPKKLALVGEVTHYLDNISVAIIKTTKPLKQDDILLIEGDDFLFTQPIDEMQIDRKPVKRAKKGSHIGLKVAFEAEVNGSVYKLG